MASQITDLIATAVNAVPEKLIHPSLKGGVFNNWKTRTAVIYAHSAPVDDYSEPGGDDADLFLVHLATALAQALDEGGGVEMSHHRLAYLVSGEPRSPVVGLPLTGRRLRLISVYHSFGSTEEAERKFFEWPENAADQRNPFAALFCFVVTGGGAGERGKYSEVKMGLVVDRIDPKPAIPSLLLLPPSPAPQPPRKKTKPPQKRKRKQKAKPKPKPKKPKRGGGEAANKKVEPGKRKNRTSSSSGSCSSIGGGVSLSNHSGRTTTSPRSSLALSSISSAGTVYTNEKKTDQPRHNERPRRRCTLPFHGWDSR